MLGVSVTPDQDDVKKAKVCALVLNRGPVGVPSPVDMLAQGESRADTHKRQRGSCAATSDHSRSEGDLSPECRSVLSRHLRSYVGCWADRPRHSSAAREHMRRLA